MSVEPMAAVDLVARSGELKRDLVEYSRLPRYHRAFRAWLREQDLDPLVVDEHRMINLVDSFVLQHRLANGRTIVEQFVAARPDLPDEERRLLLGWREVVEGIFEVQGRDGEALLLANLIDELTYRVRSNMGPKVFRQMPRRSFVVARLVPVGTEWLISGTTSVFRPADRDQLYATAAEFAVRHPGLVFRNPDKLARGWELQHADRERFVRFFGTDLVVLPGDQLDARLREFQEFSQREILAAQPRRGRTAGTPPHPPAYVLAPELVACNTVGVVYDEVEGMNFYAEFGLVEAVFADPALLRRRLHKQRVLDYLDDDSVSPLPFRRLADRDPDRASAVFAALLRRPGFDWSRDGETLMRQRKAVFFARPPLPSITPIGDRLAPYVRRS